MYLFLLYLFVHFVNEVDLWDPKDHRVYDRAAETAKLIDIVKKTDKFEVKYPLKSNDRDVDKATDDVDILETMKLLQKNYDIIRKFNVLRKGERLRYISNPEVLETYKNLGDSDRQQTEAYDDLDIHGTTLRSYFNELSNFRYFRTNDKNRTEGGSVKNDDNDTAKTKKVNKRRHIGEEKKSEDKGSASDSSHSPENSENVNKYNEAFDLVRPIVAEMLSKYVVKESQEKRTDFEKNRASNNPMQWNLTKNENVNTESEGNDEDIRTEASELKTNIKRFKKPAQVDIDEKVMLSLISGEQKKKVQKKTKLDNDPRNDRIFKNKFKKIPTENFNIDPTITIEHTASEEMKKHPVNQNRNSNIKSKQGVNIDTDHNLNTQLKQKKTKIKEEKETDKSGDRVSMEEHVINWSDYDENKQDSKMDEEKSSKNNKNKKSAREEKIKKVKNNIDNKKKKRLTSIENIKEDDEHNQESRYKSKVSTKRKGDWDEKNDDWDQNSDDKKGDNTFKKKVNDWDKKEDDSYKSKDRKPQNSRIEKDDYDSNKKRNKGTKKEIDKKDDDWNKSNDEYDKKNDDWNKQDDKWNKKDDDYYVKEEKKKVKHNKWINNDDNDNLKRGSSWDSVATNKKQNSGWGSYDSFKNILDEKNKNENNIVKPVEIPKSKVKIDIKLPKPSSWDSYDRESHHNKPKKQGRMGMHRTPIPIVGKRPLYAD